MQNIKYLKAIISDETKFGIILQDFTQRYDIIIQYKIAVSIFEFFNNGKFVTEDDIEKSNDIFYISKEKYIANWLDLK